MKSEFYRQISHSNNNRKSTTHHKHKKQTQHSAQIIPIKTSKGLKSEGRGLIRSIDLNKRYKQQMDNGMMRISFSRPLINLQNESQQIPINQKSIVSVCCQCQNLKSKHQKNLKSLKMQYEEQVTIHNEKFIQMEKKYLLKQKDYIKLSSQYNQLSQNYQQLNQKLKLTLNQMEQLRYNFDCSEEQIGRLIEEIKKHQNQNKFFNHFLTAFVDQTKCMIHWTTLFQKNYEELPQQINNIKQDLTYRKIDLDIMLKQSINFQNNNFGSIPKLYSEASFFSSQVDCNESFMKYLKQNTGATKIKGSRVSPFIEKKEHSCDSEMSTINKQNIDIANRPSFYELIHSRLNQQMEKQKNEQKNDSFLRILLAQAQTIESSIQLKSSITSNKSRYVNTSMLSSISKKPDFDIQ